MSRLAFTPHTQLLKDRQNFIAANTNWQEILSASSGVHYYQSPNGEMKTVRDWVRSMQVYIFHPVEFFIEDEECVPHRYRIEELRIPAFNEGQAYALADISVKTFDGYQYFDKQEEDYFCGYEIPLKLRCYKMPASVHDFILPEQESGIDYRKDGALAHSNFLFDFADKYAFERGLIPVGEPIAFLSDWYKSYGPYVDFFGDIAEKQD